LSPDTASAFARATGSAIVNAAQFLENDKLKFCDCSKSIQIRRVRITTTLRPRVNACACLPPCRASDNLAFVETSVASRGRRVGSFSEMSETDEAENGKEAESDSAKLERALVEAHYLGLSLRALAANRNFRYAAITASVCELLIGWAKFVGDRIQAGEEPFATRPAPRRPPHKK